MLIRDICQRSIGKEHSFAGPLLLLTLLFIIQHTAFAKLSINPRHSDATIFHSASLNCSSVSHEKVQWLHYDWKSPSNGTLIYGNGQFTQAYRDRFSLEKSGSTSSLVIPSVQREDAGEYECREGEGGGSSSRATLIVLEAASSFVLVYIVAGVAAFCLLLVAIFCFAGGIFLQTRKPLRLFVSSDEDKRRGAELSEIKISPESKDESLTVWMEMAQSERKEKEALKKELEQKINEVEHLRMGKCHLENRFYSSDNTKYADKSIAVETLEIPDSKTKPITGMTIITKELFVTQQKLSQVAVYNVVTMKFKRTVKPISNFDPLDLASCTRKECLYMCATRNEGQKAEILRFEKDGSLQKNWSVGGNCSGGTLSICRRNNNVIACLTEENEIKEFSCDGELVRTVKLHPSASIRQPCHALKTTDRHFVICHGNSEDVTHRVCAIDSEGVLLKSYGKKKGSDKQQMNRPIYLTEDANGNILVADMKNNRILLLNSALDLQRELISAANKSNGGLRLPNRICLDEERHRLFIGDSDAKKNSDCRVLVYTISSG